MRSSTLTATDVTTTVPHSCCKSCYVAWNFERSCKREFANDHTACRRRDYCGGMSYYWRDNLCICYHVHIGWSYYPSQVLNKAGYPTGQRLPQKNEWVCIKQGKQHRLRLDLGSDDDIPYLDSSSLQITPHTNPELATQILRRPRPR